MILATIEENVVGRLEVLLAEEGLLRSPEERTRSSRMIIKSTSNRKSTRMAPSTTPASRVIYYQFSFLGESEVEQPAPILPLDPFEVT